MIYLTLLSFVWLASSLITYNEIQIENYDIGRNEHIYSYNSVLKKGDIENCDLVKSSDQSDQLDQSDQSDQSNQSDDQVDLVLFLQSDIKKKCNYFLDIFSNNFSKTIIVVISDREEVKGYDEVLTFTKIPITFVSFSNRDLVLSLIDKNISISNNMSAGTKFANSYKLETVRWTMFSINLFFLLIAIQQIYTQIRSFEKEESIKKYLVYFFLTYCLIDRVIFWSIGNLNYIAYDFLWWSYFISGHLSFAVLLSIWIIVSSAFFSEEKSLRLRRLNRICSAFTSLCLFALVFRRMSKSSGPLVHIFTGFYALLIPVILAHIGIFIYNGIVILKCLSSNRMSSPHRNVIIKKFTAMMIGVGGTHLVYVFLVGIASIMTSLSDTSSLGMFFINTRIVFDIFGLMMLVGVLFGLYTRRRERTFMEKNEPNKAQNKLSMSEISFEPTSSSKD